MEVASVGCSSLNGETAAVETVGGLTAKRRRLSARGRVRWRLDDKSVVVLQTWTPLTAFTSAWLASSPRVSTQLQFSNRKFASSARQNSLVGSVQRLPETISQSSPRTSYSKMANISHSNNKEVTRWRDETPRSAVGQVALLKYSAHLVVGDGQRDNNSKKWNVGPKTTANNVCQVGQKTGLQQHDCFSDFLPQQFFVLVLCMCHYLLSCHVIHWSG